MAEPRLTDDPSRQRTAPSGLAQSPGPLCRDRLPRLVARITRLNQERSVPAPLACVVQGFVNIDPDEQHEPAHVAAAEIALLQDGQLITSTFLGAHPDAAAHPDKLWARAHFQLPLPENFDLSRSYDLHLRLRDEDKLRAVRVRHRGAARRQRQ